MQSCGGSTSNPHPKVKNNIKYADLLSRALNGTIKSKTTFYYD